MANRTTPKRNKDRAYFRNTANKTKQQNISSKPLRGGIRL